MHLDWLPEGQSFPSHPASMQSLHHLLRPDGKIVKLSGETTPFFCNDLFFNCFSTEACCGIWGSLKAWVVTWKFSWYEDEAADGPGCTGSCVDTFSMIACKSPTETSLVLPTAWLGAVSRWAEPLFWASWASKSAHGPEPPRAAQAMPSAAWH
jgi:hypothetical protein